MDSKIILISGASRGIGKQTAIELTKCGYTVIAGYNKSEQSAKELPLLRVKIGCCSRYSLRLRSKSNDLVDT